MNREIKGEKADERDKNFIFSEWSATEFAL